MPYSSIPWTTKNSNFKNTKVLKGQDIPNEFKSKYNEFFNEKITMLELCNIFSVSDTTVRRWRDILKLPKKQRGRARSCIHSKGTHSTKAFEEIYLRFYNYELTQVEVQKLLGCDIHTVLKHAKKLNLPVRESKRPFKKLKNNVTEEKNLSTYTIFSIILFGYELSLKKLM